MRVLQLHTPYRQPGGEDAVVRAEAEVLRRSGHEVVQYQVQNPPGAAGAIGSLVLSPWNPLQARRVQHLAERIRTGRRPRPQHLVRPVAGRPVGPAPLGVPTVMTLHNYRLVCANGQLFRDGAPCEDCVGASPWHGVQHGCYRDSIVLSVPAAGTIALHDRLHTWCRTVDRFVVLSEFAAERLVRGDSRPTGSS